MKKILGYLLLILILFVVAACDSSSNGTSKSKENSGEPVFLDFVSSTPGGAWYPPATAMELIITENVENVSARVTPGGGEANVRELGKRNVQLAYTQTANSSAGYLGDTPYDEEYDNLRHLFTTTPVGLHIAVKKDSGIESIEDLKDKKIGFSPQGYMANTIAEHLFETYGFTLEDIKNNGGTISYLGLTEGPQSLVDGHVDVFIGQGLWPYAPFMEVDHNPGVKFLTIEDDIYEKFVEKYPNYSQFTIDKESYESLDEDIKTVGTYASVISSADVSEDVIYEIVKEIWENVEEIHEASPQDEEWMTLENVTSGSGIPLHPGAEKYYKEIGLDIE